MAAPPRVPRILVVEDQMLIAMEIVSLLEDIGCQPVGPVGRLVTAMIAATKEDFDAALLDVDLHGESVQPLADFLAQKGVPFAFVSGFARERLPPTLRDRPYVAKPFTHEGIKSAVAALFSAA